MGDSATQIVRRILSENPRNTVSDASLTPAGVLLLLYPKDGKTCVLLTKRSSEVEHHKGEVCFPGGRKDEEDAALLDTALREAHEEMGVRPQDVTILGQLDDVPTVSRFLIHTFVGTIPYPYDFKPSAAEVAEALEVPLSELAARENWRDEVRIVDNTLVNAPTYAYNGHLIFGATARVLKRFLELLDAAPDREALWTTRQPQRLSR